MLFEYQFNLSVAGYGCQLFLSDSYYYNLLVPHYLKSDIKNIDFTLYIKTTEGSKVKTSIEPDKKSGIIELTGKHLTYEYFSYLIESGLASLLLNKGILFLHASSIVINGNAFIFCGEIGEGKSTLRLLAKEYNSLSDDTTVIRRQGQHFYLYPSPFDMIKIPSMSNMRVLIRKIFFIKQSKKTELKELTMIQRTAGLLRFNSLNSIAGICDKKLLIMETLRLPSSVKICRLNFAKNMDFISIISQ